MILDYNYNQQKSTLTISYIDSNGNKKLITKNVRRFKTYKSDPLGEFKNWDGSRCTVAHTDRPHSFDLKTYFEELPIKNICTILGISETAAKSRLHRAREMLKEKLKEADYEF